MNKRFWLPSSAGCLTTDGGMENNSSLKTEPKRGHQLFMDASEPELFSNKRKAVEAFNNGPVALSNNSSLQAVSGRFNRLSGSEPVRVINPFDMNIPSLGIGNMNMGRNHFEGHFRNECSVGLSVPRQIEVPLASLHHFDFKTFKFNKVCDPYNGMPVTMGHSFSKGDNNATSMAPFYNKNDNRTTQLAPHHKDANYTISVEPIFNKPGENLSSQSHLSNKGDGSFMLMGHIVNKGDKNILSRGQPYQYGKKDGHIISMDGTYNKAHENFTLTDSNYYPVNENFVSFGPSYNTADKSSSSKVDEHIRLMGPTYGRVHTGIASKCAIYEKGVYSIPSMGQNCDKGDKGIVPFGGFFNDETEENSSEKIISSNNVLVIQSTSQASEVVVQKYLIESNAGPNVKFSPCADSETNASAKNKKAKSPKQVPGHNFPANVKTLLSTGILDGVPVKYVSWKRDKSLRGVIEGTGYKCSCKECNHTKSLNAFEFERHAGFKTKHPNKNIYFANGKSVYVVAQELKNTPVEKLFAAIENVTDSPINQKNFHSWKESFQVANRELQRIYAKNEVTMPSENKDLASSKV